MLIFSDWLDEDLAYKGYKVRSAMGWVMMAFIFLGVFYNCILIFCQVARSLKAYLRNRSVTNLTLKRDELRTYMLA